MNVRTHLPITRTSQSVLDIVSNVFVRKTSSETSFHTHLSPPNSRENQNASCSNCAAFQLGCHLSAQLHAISSISKAQLQCNKLQYVRAAATSKLSSTADCQFSCNSSIKCAFLAQLHMFRTATNSKLCIQMYQSSCVLSAHWHFTWFLVLCQQCCSALFFFCYGQSGKLRCWGRCQVQ